MTPARLTELRAIESRMTKGSWSFRVVKKSPPVERALLIGATAPNHQIVSTHDGGSSPAFDGDGIAALRNAFPELLTALEEARAFAEKAAKAYNDLLVETRVLTCAFCGQAYPHGTTTSQNEELTKHIAICEKHPMRALEEKIERQAKRIEELEGALKKIACPHGGCGCSPVCVCETQSVLSIWKHGAQDEARSALASKGGAL